MARIPTEHIERIKNEVSLLRLIEGQGHKVAKVGKDHAISCPFHDGDNTPSLIISPKSNLYHCFGCGAAGSVIDWVMKINRLPFRDAALWLSDEFDVQGNTEIEKTSSLAAQAANPSLAACSESSVETSAEDQSLLKRVVDFYHETLQSSEEAKGYLKRRGLDCVELIKHFTLGYANRSLGKSLLPKNRKDGAEIRTQLQEVGVYRESGHEHFNGSLVVPVIDELGNVTEMYGRKLLENLRSGTPKHLYLPGPHRGIFNPECMACSEVILCESLIDALTFWRWGFKNVTTSYGTEGFTQELQEAFKTHDVEHVLFAYDNDEPGNRAAEKHAELLLKRGINCSRVLFPSGMDANFFAGTVNEPDKALGLLLRQAESMGDAEIMEALACESPLSLAAKSDLAEPPEAKGFENKDDMEVSENEVMISLGGLRYRVRGLQKATSYEQLKINLAAMRDALLHVDQLDLYNAKSRQSFIKQAALELDVNEDVLKKDLAKVLLKLEQLQDAQIQKAIEPKDSVIELTSVEREQALELLKDKHLLRRTLDDFNRAGVVGEETNKLVGYLAAVSRKLDNPLAVIIQSTSAAGKSALMNAVLAMMPEEERIQYSAMTGQSLFYMGETNLKHKILAIAEEEGAENASYALKLLQSEGELTIASTGKDADGNLTTQEYRVEGPVMLFSTTTAIDIDEELMNRCVVLTVNESREQTQLIHELQRERETLEGLLADEDRKSIIQLHRNAQRLLKPLKVVNPYAPQLTFMNSQTRSRRDHMKYLRLIKTIALLHQYQRPVKSITHNGQHLEYVEVALDDIAVANELAHEVLGRSLDELPPQTRKLLTLVHEMVGTYCKKEKMLQKDFRFSRRDVREYSGWGDTQLKIHLSRLAELEYLLIHKHGQKFSYELQYQGEGEKEKAFLMNLIDVDELKKSNSATVPDVALPPASMQSYDGNRSGVNTKRSAPGRGAVGARSGGSRPEENPQNPINTVLNSDLPKLNGKTHSTVEKTSSSYPSFTS